MPRGICDSCRTILRRKDEGKDVNLPPLFPFSSIKVRPPTRDQGCNCLICQVGHLKLNEKSPVDYSKPVEHCTPQRCGDCLSLVGRGLPHQCTPFTFRENLKQLATADPLAAEQIATQVISTKPSTPGGTAKISHPKGGPPLRVKTGDTFIYTYKDGRFRGNTFNFKT